VRIVYLDEAGISNPRHEPFVTVAGVIVNGDRQWLSVEQHLRELTTRYIPDDKPDGFFFHATELFSGGKTFTRDKWPRDQRWAILRELCEIPSLFKLPVVVAHIERSEFAKSNAELSRSELTVHAHLIASVVCTITVERYMRQHADKDEVALLIHENNDRAAAWMRGLHNTLRTQHATRSFSAYNDISEFLPLSRIIDTIHFAAKTDTSILQIADACAFVCKRKLMGKRESDYFFEPLKSVFV
jgi:hypothetical protein